MTIVESIFLGLLQGITEFLPVSSSGHLVLAEHLLHIHIDPAALLGFDVLLHTGTLLALFFVYRSHWTELISGFVQGDTASRQFILLLIIGTVPAAVLGTLFKDTLTEQFRSIESVAISLIATAGILIIAEWGKEIYTMKQLTIPRVLIIGCMQACALIPGISRSGITITGGRLTGLKRSEALDFSFLLATPAIAGATLLTIFDVMDGSIQLPSISVTCTGMFVSFISSLFAIFLLKEWVRRISLAWFGVYLIPMALLLLLT